VKSLAILSLALAALTVGAFAGNETQAPGATSAPPSQFADMLTGDWGGARQSLADHGILANLIYTGEVLGNTTGGFRRATIYEGLVQVNLDVDLQKILGWPGGKIHVVAYDPHGAGLTQRALGDVGVLSSIDAYDSIILQDLWFEENLWNGCVSLRIGLTAVDDEFYQSPMDALFVRSNFGWSSILGLNVPVASYPYGSPGVRLKLQPANWNTTMIGVYDGNPAPGVFPDPSPNAAPSNEFNRHGTHWALRSDEGVFLIAETNFHFNDPPDPNAPPAPAGDAKKAVKTVRGLATSVKIGAAYHTDTFSDAYDAGLIGLHFTGQPARARARGGDWAVNALWDQELYRTPGTETQGLSGFLHATYMPPDRNAYDFSAEAGLIYTGLLPGRASDMLGLGYNLIHSGAANAAATRDANRFDGTHLAIPDYEQAIELTYNAHVRPGVWVQPDVQLVVHPGASSAHGSALVIGLRTTITF
jgi:porin